MIIALDHQRCSETGKSNLVAYGGTPLLTGDRQTCLPSNGLPWMRYQQRTMGMTRSVCWLLIHGQTQFGPPSTFAQRTIQRTTRVMGCQNRSSGPSGQVVPSRFSTVVVMSGCFRRQLSPRTVGLQSRFVKFGKRPWCKARHSRGRAEGVAVLQGLTSDQQWLFVIPFH